MVIDAAVVGAKVGIGAAGTGGGAAGRVSRGVSTVIGSSTLSSDFGCMFIPTAPMMPQIISAPSRIVTGSRTPSRVLTCDGPGVRHT